MTIAQMIYIFKANRYDFKALPEYGNVKECLLAALINEPTKSYTVSEELKEDEDVLALLLEGFMWYRKNDEPGIEEIIVEVKNELDIDFERVKEKIAGIWIASGYPILTNEEIAKIKEEEARDIKRYEESEQAQRKDVDKPSEKDVDKLPEKDVEELPEKDVDEPSKKDVDKPSEKDVDEPSEKDVEEPSEKDVDISQEYDPTREEMEAYNRYIRIFGDEVVPGIVSNGDDRQLDFIDELTELVIKKKDLQKKLSDIGDDIVLKVELFKVNNRLMELYGRSHLWWLNASSQERQSVTYAEKIGEDIIPWKNGRPLIEEIGIEDVADVIGDRCCETIENTLKTIRIGTEEKDCRRDGDGNSRV